MQVVQTVNDTIKVLYSPNMENLCLGDFLLVQEGKKRFLAQITEIVDEKSDLSQNIAQIKLLFTVSENDEVLPYDNSTPSKECKILHTRQKDIEDFVNISKTTFPLATNPKTGLPLEFNLEFFENRPLIFADKLEETNTLFCNLANKLSPFKNVVVFDYTGSLEIENAKRFTAVKDFKLPLSVTTLDAIWEKGLESASLETQAVCEEIFNEVKSFLKESDEGYLPFNRFVKVIEEQYEKTPIRELLVLKNRLNRYQQNEIFAKNKKEFQAIQKSKSKVIIIDLSKLKTEWHKDFSAFALDCIQKESFVMLRLNDLNSNPDFIKELYERDLSPVPSISYNFKRMASITEYCRNYVLLPTLNPRRDFGYVSGAICALSSEHALFWGVDTKNFIFTIVNELHCLPDGQDEKKPVPVKMKFVGSEEILDINIKDVSTKDKDVQEFLNLKETAQEPAWEVAQEPVYEPVSEFVNGPQEPQEPQEAAPEPELPEWIAQEDIPLQTFTPEDLAESVSTDEVEIEAHEASEAPAEEEQVLERKFEEGTEHKTLNVSDFFSKKSSKSVAEKSFEEPEEGLISEEELDFFNKKHILSSEDDDRELGDIKEFAFENELQKEAEEAKFFVQEPFENEASQEAEEETYIEQAPFEEMPQEVFDDESGGEQLVKSFIEEIEEEPSVSKSVEASFEEIMNDDASLADKDKLVINENISIDLRTIKDKIPKDDDNLPVFPTDAASECHIENFNEGDSVEHDKYGRGQVTKVVKYANRCLLQIEFEEVGKRLLDPRIANIRKPAE
ncbi:hypothetical protein tpqmel_0741 [Candidatus Gastranaerophilus sp. (ex Termes propinquus)]|nr:hypothetical protein tpqmel_0741 [Candidatus Gastranaerophilus sp. (ex Termes propinquus)]